MSVPAATPLAPAPARGRLKQLGNVVVVLGVVALAATLASYVMPAQAPSQDTPPAVAPPVQRAAETHDKTEHTVVYQLGGEGDGDAGARDLTYAVQDEELVQADQVSTPWSTTFTRTGGAGYSSLTARNAGPGELRCRILVDGAVIAEKTVNGEGAQLTCVAA